MESSRTAGLEKAEEHALRALLMIVEREVALPEAIELAYWAELDKLAGIELPAAPENARSEIFEAFEEFLQAPESERRSRASLIVRSLINLHLTIVEARSAPLQHDR